MCRASTSSKAREDGLGDLVTGAIERATSEISTAGSALLPSASDLQKRRPS